MDNRHCYLLHLTRSTSLIEAKNVSKDGWSTQMFDQIPTANIFVLLGEDADTCGYKEFMKQVGGHRLREVFFEI